MSEILSQCPRCSRAFRITPAQLTAADGLVRCGNCEEIFKPQDSLLQELTAPGHGDPASTGSDYQPASATLTTLSVSALPPANDFVFQAEFIDSPDFQGRSSPPGYGTLRQDPAPELTVRFEVPAAAATDSLSAGRLTLPAMDDPIELHSRGRRRFTALVFLGCVLLSLTLAGQYLWYERATLSEQPRLRLLLTHACRFLDCPALLGPDMEAFRIEQSLVHSHPDYPRGLELLFTFRNTAPYHQPFPALELRFLDSEHQTLARRLFRPEEYLPDTLIDLKQLSINRPVQVQLAIADPGAAAVDYQLRFVEAFPSDYAPAGLIRPTR